MFDFDEIDVLQLKNKITTLEENDEKQNVRISNLEEDVDHLKCDVAEIKTNLIKTDEQLKYIIQSQQDIKDNIAQLNTSTTQSISVMSQAVVQMISAKTQKDVAEINNNTQLEITKENNKSSLTRQLLITGAAFLTGTNLESITKWLKGLFE